MGQSESSNVESSTNSSGAKEFFKQYNLVKTQNDPNIGEYTLYEDKYNEYADYVMVKELRCDSKVEYDEIVEKLNRREGLSNDYLVNMVANYSNVETEWCSKYYRHFLAYEHSSLTFEKELHDRYRMMRAGTAVKVSQN